MKPLRKNQVWTGVWAPKPNQKKKVIFKIEDENFNFCQKNCKNIMGGMCLFISIMTMCFLIGKLISEWDKRSPFRRAPTLG